MKGSTKGRQEDTMLLKLYSIAIIIVDVVLLFVKSFWIILYKTYEKIVPPQEKPVAGEVVLITGTGHGIGRELAVQYAELGAIVVCVDINTSGNEETVKIINEKGLNKVHSYTCDVSNREEVLSVVERIKREVGPVTVLVNNAGIMPCHEFLNHKPEVVKKIFDVNVFAHFWLLEAILPDMRQKNHGHIVALSSMAGIVGLRNLIPYCSSKFAVRGLMEGLAEEFREEGVAPNVHFTCVFPYMVNTGLCKKPRMRFPGILDMVNPKVAAAHIIHMMRTNTLCGSIPSWYLMLNDFLRVFPIEVARYMKDFMDITLDAD